MSCTLQLDRVIISVPFVCRRGAEGVREVGVLTNRTMSSHGSLDTQQPNNQQVHSDPPRGRILDHCVAPLSNSAFNDSSRFFAPSRYYTYFNTSVFSKKLCMVRKRIAIEPLLLSMNKSIDSHVIHSNGNTNSYSLWRFFFFKNVF